MIFSCSNKNKSDEFLESKRSGAGMTDEEIKNLSLEELVSLKNSITNYLKCRKLKNRNNEFCGLFMKINNEINIRNSNVTTVKKPIFETKIDKNPSTAKNQTQHCSLGLANTKSNESLTKKNIFLKRKFSFSQSLLDIVFPSFLNDNEKQTGKTSPVKESTEEASQTSSDFLDEEKPVKKKIRNKKCIKGNIQFNIDFDQGLFNQKIDVNYDDLIVNFISPSMDNAFSKKEEEIRNTLFNTVPEDLFFELE